MLAERLERGWSARTTPTCSSAGASWSSSAAAASSSASQPAGSRALRVPGARTAARSGAGELIERSGPATCRANRASALTVLLSKLRAAVGADVLAGRGSVRVALPPDARVDVEQALAALHRAESAVVQGEWARAWSAALCARYVTAPLLPGPRRPSVAGLVAATTRRRARQRAGSCTPPPAWDSAAPRSRRRARGAPLLEHNPLRETGYGLLGGALAARGNVAEALACTSAHAQCSATSSASRPAPLIHEIHATLLAPR